MPTAKQLVTGLAGAIGCDFRTAQNQLIFVEYGGKLSTLDLFPTPTIVAQSASTVLKGTFTFDLDTGTEGGTGANYDIFWEQMTTVLRQMAVMNTAQIVNLGAVDFNSLTAPALASLTYASTPIDGNNDATNKLTVGDVFAVRTTNGNYAKVKVLAYGYDLTIQWVTYNIPSGYKVIGTGYTNPEDVKMSVDNLHCYVTERSGDLVKVALTAANRASATVVATGMTAPQQLFLDELHNAAYVVEYAAAGSLLRVITLSTGAKTAITSALNFPVGVTLSSDLQYAYVSEQTTGPDSGRISSIQLSTATRTTIVKGLTAPFFLTWADAAQDALFVPLRDPSNSIISVNITLDTSNVVATGVPLRPSSVAIASPGELLICSDSVIEEIAFTPFPLNGPLLMGIGFIPFDKINQTGPFTGMADTSVDPSYFYQVKDTPFGGTLPIMVNYQTALTAGASYYQVKIDGVPHTDVWSDYLWNGTAYVIHPITPTTVGPSTGCYPTRPLAQLFLWMNPSLGDLLDTTGLSNGTHTLTLQFLNGAGAPLVATPPLTILVNNQPSVASLQLPLLSGSPADACGVLHYGTNKAAVVSIGFTASQPANFANFSFSMVRGVTGVALPWHHPQPAGRSTRQSPPLPRHRPHLAQAPAPPQASRSSSTSPQPSTNGWSRRKRIRC